MKETSENIFPADYPGLAKLVWNRDPARPVDGETAFALYERNWRFVDARALTERERELVERPRRDHGNGFLLV